MLKKTLFRNAVERVRNIKNTENSYYVDEATKMPSLKKYSSYGLSSAGARLGFPAKFLNEIAINHSDLAEQVLTSRAEDYFRRIERHNRANSSNRKKSNQLFIREFEGMVHGVLTDRYSVFDDDEVINILESSEYLMNASEIWSDITPDHFHLRFISGNKLFINGDESPLSMAVFVDNSMVGDSSLKIRFGIYRWACTNGLISGLKEFNILKEVHHGEKDYILLLKQALEEVPKYEQMMLEKVQEMAETESSIYKMTEEEAVRYIKDKLNIGKKDATKIFTVYNEEYGGKTKWDLCNAITFVARDFEEITDRLHYEENALKVA